MAKRKLSWVQIAGLALFTIVFPLISWYYLQRGYNYRLQSLQELQELGTVSAYTAVNQNGDTISLDQLRGKVLIAGFYPEDAATRETMRQHLSGLHEQFDARGDILFLVHEAGSNANEAAELASQLGIEDDEQYWVMGLPESNWKEVARGAYHWPQDSLSGDYDPGLLALVDTAGMVKNHYHLDVNQEMGRLVEHITIVMPRIPERDLEFKRETEK